MVGKVVKKVAKKLIGSARKKGAVASKTEAKRTPVIKKKEQGKVTQEELFCMIEKKAYELFQKRGHTHGNDRDDWFEAEKKMKSKIKK